MATLLEIDSLTATFSARREALAGSLMAYREDQAAIERKHFGRLRRLAVQMREAHSQLSAAIEESAPLFERPRTVILHGVKVGLAKARGKIEWEDDDQVVKLIRRHFPDQEILLIKTIESPVKDALAQLPAADLKRLGITVQDTGDVVVIKPIDSEVEKALKALMQELPEEIEEEAHA